MLFKSTLSSSPTLRLTTAGSCAAVTLTVYAAAGLLLADGSGDVVGSVLEPPQATSLSASDASAAMRVRMRALPFTIHLRWGMVGGGVSAPLSCVRNRQQ